MRELTLLTSSSSIALTTIRTCLLNMPARLFVARPITDGALPGAAAMRTRAGVRMAFSFADAVAGTATRGACIPDLLVSHAEPFLKRRKVLRKLLPKLFLFDWSVVFEESFTVCGVGCDGRSCYLREPFAINARNLAATTINPLA